MQSTLPSSLVPSQARLNPSAVTGMVTLSWATSSDNSS